MARIVLIGAGSSVFGYNMVQDAANIEALHGSKLVLHDIDEARLAAMKGLAEAVNAETGARLEIEATIDRAEALDGAEFVVVSIAVDRMNRWRLDWKIPYSHGIKQVIGENGGPGGLFHTLRNIPPVMEIAHDVEEICPEALMLNYTNPVPRLCLAVSRYTDVNVVGLCHEVEHQLQRLAPLMGVPSAILDAVSAGLNHFSWYKELRLKDGADAYPLLREAMASAKGFQPLCRAMYDKFGLYPSTDDNHLGEYLAYAWDICPEEDRGFNWIDRCERQGQMKWLQIKRLIDGEEPLDVRGRLSGERAMHIVAGVLTSSNHMELQVNAPNEGQIPNLIGDAVVETPAVVTGGGVKPIHVGELPRGLAALCNMQILIGSLAVEAGVKGDVNLARQAMMVDPVVNDTEAAEKAFNELMEAHADLLPQFMEGRRCT